MLEREWHCLAEEPEGDQDKAAEAAEGAKKEGRHSGGASALSKPRGRGAGADPDPAWTGDAGRSRRLPPAAGAE